AKVSDKIALVRRFIETSDRIIIGGAMANTFLAYKGFAMGKSKVESDQQEVLDSIYAAAAEKVGAANVHDFILLPTDVAVAREMDASEPRRVVAVDHVGEDDMVLDIGANSIDAIRRALENAKTVVWNGTLGCAELQHFSEGSAALAAALAGNPEITSVIGGGDTADFAQHWDEKEGGSFTHVSTGGGAS